MRHVRHFINGEFVDSADGKSFESISPIDNQVIATVSEGAAEDADRAVRAARAAFPGWAAMAPSDRRKILSRVADGIEVRLEELAEWETLDMGKTITAARTKDMPAVRPQLSVLCRVRRAGWHARIPRSLGMECSPTPCGSPSESWPQYPLGTSQ